MPHVEDYPRARNSDIWKTISYTRFIERVERENPHTVLTKDIVDAAFHLVVSRTDSWASGLGVREKAIARVSMKRPHSSHITTADDFSA